MKQELNCKKKRPHNIKVIGIGGAGGNTVEYLQKDGIAGGDLILCNTDVQVLQNSTIRTKIQLGEQLTKGFGAEGVAQIGEDAANESLAQVRHCLDENTDMAFIVAGMGGGTGTGAAPVIAQLCRDMGLLTIAIVTMPFLQEGDKRVKLAQNGLTRLRPNVDSLFIINNQMLGKFFPDLTLNNAFIQIYKVAANAVKGLAELIALRDKPNIDFAATRTTRTTNENSNGNS